MVPPGKIVIEIMFKAHDCLICHYMDEALREVLPDFRDHVEYRRIDILEAAGKKRFLELSVALFGTDGVFKKMRLAPVPSMFINGELFFDTIPPRHMLEKAIKTVIEEPFSKNNDAKSKR